MQLAKERVMKNAFVFIAATTLASLAWAQAPRPVPIGDVAFEGQGNCDSRADTFVYLNLSNPTPPEPYYVPYSEAGAAYGDDAHLTSGGPLSMLSFWYYDPAGGPALTQVTVSFYENDANNTNFPGGNPSPALLGAYTITGLPGDGAHLVMYAVTPPITLPRDVWVEFDFSNSTEAGLILYNPPTIGTSQDLFYVHGVSKFVFGYPYVANFGLGLAINTELPCPGDLNHDRQRNLDDLAAMLANYGLSGATPEQGDINGDGTVNLDDLAGLLSVYGIPCP
jgi:hypothetical protein